MRSSVHESRLTLARHVEVTNAALVVEMTDGRTLSVPISWYPRLAHGTRRERSNWRLIARGVGIHWPDLDEDISISGLLAGQPSRESPSSLRNWMRSRATRAKNAPAKKRRRPAVRSRS